MIHLAALRQRKEAAEQDENKNEEETGGEFTTLVKGEIAKWEADFDGLVARYPWASEMLLAINGQFVYGRANLHMALFLHRNAALAAALIYSVEEAKRAELARELIAALPSRVQTGGSTFSDKAPDELGALGGEYVDQTFGEAVRKVTELHPAPANRSQFTALARRVFDHSKGYSWTVIFMDRFVKDWPKLAAGRMIGATDVVSDWLKSLYNDNPITGKWMGSNRTPAEILASEKQNYGMDEIQKIASLLYQMLREREQLEGGAMVPYAVDQWSAVTTVLTPCLGADKAGAVADELIAEAKKHASTT